MPRLSRLTIAYLIVVLGSVSWAMYTEGSLLHSNREHLMPAFVLGVVTMPSSLSTNVVFSYLPGALVTPFVGIGWLLLCGMFQALVLQLILDGRRQQR